MKYIIFILVAFLLSSSFATDFSIRCGGGGDSSGSSATLSLDEDTVRALVVFASGGDDCPALNAHEYRRPSWKNELFNVNNLESVAKYYYDNSRGTLLLTATVERRGLD